MGEFLDVDESSSGPPSRPKPGDRRFCNSLCAQDQRDLSWSACWIVDSTRATQPERYAVLFASAGKRKGLLVGNVFVPIFIPQIPITLCRAMC